jgi:hypothetical protein
VNVVLFTGNECDVCHQVEEAFKKKFKEELESGEADIVNLDEEEDAQQFWMEHDLPLAPTVIVVSDKEKLICVLDPKSLLEEGKETLKPEKAAAAPLDKKPG